MFVSAQTTQTVSQTNSFEQMVVKENFLTRNEIKQHLDQKALEFQQYAKAEIQDAFNSLVLWVDAKMNKFVFKLVMAIVGSLIFAQSLWYFLKRKLDTRFQAILDMRREIKQERNEERFEAKEQLREDKKAVKKAKKEVKEKEKVEDKKKQVINPSIIPKPSVNNGSVDYKEFQEFKLWKKNKK